MGMSAAASRWPSMKSLIFFVFAWHVAICQAKLSDIYDNLYPDYGPSFTNLIQRNCSSEYAAYLRDDDGAFSLDDGTSFGNFGTANAVLNCVLGVTPEIVKAKMSSAQIILGLAPSLLATVGIRPQDSAILAVLGRKPLLALLFAGGAPAVFNFRASEYSAAIADLRDPGLEFLQFKSKTAQYALTTVVYLIAIASAANIAELAWELADRVPFAAFPSDPYLPFVWVYVGFVIHIMASLTLWTSVQIESSRPETVPLMSDHEQSHKDSSHQVYHKYSGKNWLKGYFRFEEFAQDVSVRVTPIFPKSSHFYALSWLTSMTTTCHIVFGTILFASAILISITDSLKIIGRLLGSAIVCRILLKIELGSIKGRTTVVQEEKKDE